MSSCAATLPPLVLVFLCYFFLADQIAPSIGLQDSLRTAPDAVKAVAGMLFGRLDQVDAFVTAAITLGLYEGAYVAEIVRGGIRSVDAGQWEAGRAQGFTRFGLMVWIIMPQAVRNMIPPLAGQIISTIKDSAIVSVISIQELTFQGMQLMATTYLTMEVWTCVALLYFVLTFSCSMAAAVWNIACAADTQSSDSNVFWRLSKSGSSAARRRPLRTCSCKR
jgi:polar amino acid transport system permease protein